MHAKGLTGSQHRIAASLNISSGYKATALSMLLRPCFYFFILFIVSVCMWVCTCKCYPYTGQRQCWMPWSRSYRQLCCTQIQILCKSTVYLYPLSHLSSPRPGPSTHAFRDFNPTSHQVYCESPTLHADNFSCNTLKREFYDLASESIWQRAKWDCETSAITGHI